MHTPSRRAFLTVAGGGLLAGCLGSPGGGTASPSAAPEPLGFEAVPDDAADPPQFERERTDESEREQGVVDVAERPTGLTALLYERSEGALEAPQLVTIGPGGERASDRTLESLPSNDVQSVERVGEATIVVEGWWQESWTSWLRGVSGTDFEVDADSGLTYSTVTVDGDSLLAAGVHRGGDDSNSTAVCRRFDLDGTIPWERTVGETGTDYRFSAVTPVSDGVLAGGDKDDETWFVRYGGDGTETWRRTVTFDDESYSVASVVSGSTGTYAVARTVHFGLGDNHLVLLSLGPEGEIKWTRVFDPNYSDGPKNLSVGWVVDAGGPVLVGHTGDRTWLAATEPDGSMRWAGYYPDSRDDGTVLANGLTTVDDGVVLYGRRGSRGSGTSTPNGWLAWLNP
ncbi:hypothetical protein [Halapricum hydrolyticum]|uniref:Uncharacterized protein n=1 Tax=Halapricum hydrolyticum TaxID=2979991 RepID=A0AAE3LE89_9EURY|nr:hypothetical protein [Halapricum hydrolyticum]MCU4717090.1 hypothetical protein [Halapricum hydrolyticum]MCU4726017.1 hypothetical protein [Halapricum hydrolyticum]